jgi:hypothetical protein
MNLLVKISRLLFLGTSRDRLPGSLGSADVFGQTLLQFFTDSAVIQQAYEFGSMHAVESLEQWTLQKILVVHDLLPARDSCLTAAAHPVTCD